MDRWEKLLSEYVETLEARGHADLWRAFTAESRTWRGRRRREGVERGPIEYRAAWGSAYQIEIWSTIVTGERGLHVFVTLYPDQRGDEAITQDFIVYPG